MKPARFAYAAPETAAEAIALLAAHRDDARLLAGGQSLMPAMNLRLARPALLVDLNGVGELSYIREDDGWLAIGAMTRQCEIEASEIVRRRVPLLHRATKWIGHRTIRNRGTIGGSLSNADPAAEDPAVALALEAVLVARGEQGDRRIDARNFFTGPLSTVLAPDELLAEIRVPPCEIGTRCAFHEISRRRGDFALAGIAVSLSMSGGRVRDSRIVACGMADGPQRLTGAEQALKGAEPSEEMLIAASGAATADVAPQADLHATSEYRRKLVGVLTRRAIAEATMDDAEEAP